MKLQDRILYAANRCFPKPVHPFDLQNAGVETYAMWQYKKGRVTVQNFLRAYTEEQMFLHKDVLDVGCGAGGKTIYYASKGAKSVTGMDILPQYEAESTALAKELGFEKVFRFVCCDAADTGMPEGSFDTIIMNDAMEHVARPDAVLNECARLLRPGGRLYVNFPPYNHPFGAHLMDLIYIPWVHLFFSEKTLVRCYKELCRTVPDGDERIAFRISKRENGEEYFSYINHMSMKRFKKMIANVPLRVEYFHTEPIRKIVSLPQKLFPEFLTRACVCVFIKE